MNAWLGDGGERLTLPGGCGRELVSGAGAALAALGVLVALHGCAERRPAWEQPPPPISTEPVVPAGRLTRATLENGLEVLLFEDPRLPRVSLGVAARRGAGTVPRQQAGLAAVTAEVMKRGAGARGAVELAQSIERLGASLSVNAGWDSMDARVSGLSRDTGTLLAILADVVRRPRFEPAEVAQARSQALAAIERQKDEPRAVAFRHLAMSLYGEHRYGLPLEGSRETVAGLDAGALRALHARVFVPAGAILYASGDLDADALLEDVRAAFGDWEGPPLAPGGPAPPEPAPPERRVTIVDQPELVQAQVLLGHGGIRRTAPDRVPVQVMNTILGGGGFSSRLMERIRAEEGLAYGAYSTFAMRRHPGPFVAWVGTRVAEAGRVVELALAELETMRGNHPSPDEVASAKTNLAGRFALGLETSGAVTAALVDLDVYGLPPDSLDTYRSRVRSVDAGAVSAAAQEHLAPERCAIVAVGPAGELRAQLERFGPVEVVEP